MAFAIAMALSISGAAAQQPTSSQDLIEGIIQDVIARTVEAANQEVRRNTGIDLLERGYDSSKNYGSARSGASEETRRELRKLSEKHDRKIAKLEEELQRKLRKAKEEFQREVGKENNVEKIKEKRRKLRKKVDQAYAKFEENIGEENRRFDEERHQILSKS
jgi:hypothetical protein